jgi:hypothetical protein
MGKQKVCKKDVTFICYLCDFTDGQYTIFQFWVDGIWDEDKNTLEEGILKYPLDKWNWMLAEDDD